MSLRINFQCQRRAFSLNVDTSIPTEGFNVIYGPSGAGKTTLLRWIAGLEKKIPGSLHFNNQCWHDQKQCTPTQQRQIGYVFQDARLLPFLTVQDNLHYAWNRRFNQNGPTIDQVCQWLELESLLDNSATQLSGGQQQRVALARALLSSPQLLLMDEPLGSLDSAAKQRIIQHLMKLRSHLSVPVLYVSHDIQEIAQLADYMLCLENGKITTQGPLIELSSRLDTYFSHEENSASIIEAVVVQHDAHYHLTQLEVGNDNERQPVYITFNGRGVGETLRLRVPARDISISLHKAIDTSILNILACKVDAIEKTSDARVLVRLQLGEQFLLARLTHKSIDRLQLRIGQAVYAQIKSVALINNYAG